MSIQRREVLVGGAVVITSVVLPAASASASPDPVVVSAPDAPVVAATVEGGEVSMTLAVAPTASSHTYELWRGTTDLGEASTTGSAPAGAVTLTIGGADGEADPLRPLAEADPHVIRVTHTNAGGSSVSTITLTPQRLPTEEDGALLGGAASGTSGGAGATSSEATIGHPAVGFGPTAVTFSLTGAAGGVGGNDGDGTGGDGGVGGTLSGRLAVRNGDVIQLHAGGVGGAGATGNGSTACGLGGGSTAGYGGGDGGVPGGSGTSGGGGGGGAATVLRRSRAGVHRDVVAPGGGGGGGTGNAARDDLDARTFADEDPSSGTSGEAGLGVGASTDGGGGGGGGGGARGGGGGDTFGADAGGRTEQFGEGGCRGEATGEASDLEALSAGLAGSLAAGTGSVTWHAVAVEHSVTPDPTAPSDPVTAAGVAADVGGTTSTLTMTLRAAAGATTHSYEVWNGRSSLTGDPEPTPSSSVDVVEGDATVEVTGLDLTQSHVVRVREENGAGWATTVIVLQPGTLGPVSGSDAGSPSSGNGGSGGDGAASAVETLTPPTAGYGTTRVHLDLTGASGGAGGTDGGQAGAAGAGQQLEGTLAVVPGDTLVIHAGGRGGAGASSTNSGSGGGGGGGSTLAHGGGVGGAPGSEGTSGAGGGGGGATVLRRSRTGSGPVRDVVASGGGGGGAGGSVWGDARAYDANDPVRLRGTAGEAGAPHSSNPTPAPSADDGGGGGGGGGGVVGGGRGDILTPSSGEHGGDGGRRGASSSADDDLELTEGSPSVPGSLGVGSGTVRWHAMSSVTHASGVS